MSDTQPPITPEILTDAPEMPLENDLEQLARRHMREVVETTIVLAKAGDTAAIKLLLDRFLPPRLRLKLGQIRNGADARERMAEVIAAVTRGDIAPVEGQRLIEMMRIIFVAHTASDLLPFESAPATTFTDPRAALRDRLKKAIESQNKNAAAPDGATASDSDSE